VPSTPKHDSSPSGRAEWVVLVFGEAMPTQHRHLPSRRHLKHSTALDPFAKTL
jgi:hypothetical protein